MNAFKRMDLRIKKNFPNYNWNWNCIFRLKSDKFQTVIRDFDVIISLDDGSSLKNYFLVKDYKYNMYTFNIVHFIETNNDEDNIFLLLTGRCFHTKRVNFLLSLFIAIIFLTN